MHQKDLSLFIVRITLIISIIVGISLILGLIGYFLLAPEGNTIHPKPSCDNIIVKSIKTGECRIYRCDQVPSEVGADFVAGHPPFEWIQVDNCAEPINNTSDWQTYRSEEYGFEFRYPKDENWNLEEQNWLDNKEIILHNRNIKGRAIAMEINLRVSRKASLQENLDYWRDNGLVAVEPLELGNLIGKKLFISNDLTMNNLSVHNESLVYLFNIGQNPTLFIFVITGIDTQKDIDLINIFNQILSTFKFTEGQAGKDELSNKVSDIKSIDDIWNVYINYELGFSIKIPKKVDNKDFKPLEGGDIVYFVIYNDTEKILNSPEPDFKKANSTSWAIIVKEVKNNSELEEFIKNLYGVSCVIEKREIFNQSKVYDITIKGDDKNFFETDCPGSFTPNITKYSPEKNKVASWSAGQAIQFSLSNGEIGDFEMKDSFKFIE